MVFILTVGGLKGGQLIFWLKNGNWLDGYG